MAEPFHIALTSAGAVSGGPYSAGVIDFIIEALEAWYAAKARGDPVPDHDVRIDAVSGTSAGAVAAGLFPAAVIRGRRTAGGHTPSLLRQVWVDSLDLRHDDGTSRGFLGLSDMQDPGDAIPSLLNSHRLDAIADEAFGSPWDPRFSPPPWLSETLRVILCVTNLPGVPYRITMQGSGPESGHDMFQHGDHGTFQFSLAPPDKPGVTHVDPHGPTGWNTLVTWALASSAFPVGLAPRFLYTSREVYEARMWPGLDQDGRCTPVRAPTQLPTGDTVRFPAVDGGMANNEPFELARRALADDICTRLPRTGEAAHSAVVLVDPFPSPFDAQAYQRQCQLRPDVTEVVAPLLSAMKQQCRFKPEELALAADSAIYSRYLVAPTGSNARETVYGDNALAGAGLGAFAGFLSLAFREHDYQLGRRNAQQFLRMHFTLPLANDLFAASRSLYAAKGARGGHLVARSAGGARDHVPIIPLMPSVSAEIPLPAWPRLPADELAAIGRAMQPRLNTMVARLGRKTCWPARLFMAAAWPFLRGMARRKIVEYMDRDLRARGLVTP